MSYKIEKNAYFITHNFIMHHIQVGNVALSQSLSFTHFLDRNIFCLNIRTSVSI
jgi:hypothetical protein